MADRVSMSTMPRDACGQRQAPVHWGLWQAHPQSGFCGFLSSSQGRVEAQDALLCLNLLCNRLRSAHHLLGCRASRLRLRSRHRHHYKIRNRKA